jgi:hypothetical protein
MRINFEDRVRRSLFVFLMKSVRPSPQLKSTFSKSEISKSETFIVFSFIESLTVDFEKKKKVESSRGEGSNSHNSGAFTMSDGYLSDVPTHHSNAGSEVSQDLIASTKMLENHFKERYQMLRNAYEQRIKQLTGVVQNMCSSFYNDELLQQLKSDRTSAFFIPSHLNEIVENHLHSEREKYVQELLQKNSTLEAELTTIRKHFHSQQEELRHKVESFQSLERQQQQKLTGLKQALQLKSEECESLQLTLEQKNHQVHILERSYEQNSRDLEVIENLEEKENKIKTEMKDQIIHLSHENHSLQERVNQLAMENEMLQEKFQANQSIFLHQSQENESQKKKISSMMTQIEQLFEQEMNESNQIILSTNEKMKNLKYKFFQQLSKEKRFSTVLQEELKALKTTSERLYHENTSLKEEDDKLKHRMSLQQEKLTHLQQELSHSHSKVKELQLQFQDLEKNKKLSEVHFQERLKTLEKEMKFNEERVKHETVQQLDTDRKLLEQKENLVKLQYENKFHQLSQELRNSYSFKSGTYSDNDENHDFNGTEEHSSSSALLSTNFHNIHDEITFRKIIQQLISEKDQLVKQLKTTEKRLKYEIENEYNSKLEVLQKAMDKESSQQTSELKKMLNEASISIEKLKNMVKDGKSVISLQNERIEQLKNQLFQAQNESFAEMKLNNNVKNINDSSVAGSNTSTLHNQSVGSFAHSSTPKKIIGNNTKTPKTAKTVKLYSPHSFDALQEQQHQQQQQQQQQLLQRSDNMSQNSSAFHQQQQPQQQHSRSFNDLNSVVTTMSENVTLTSSLKKPSQSSTNDRFAQRLQQQFFGIPQEGNQSLSHQMMSSCPASVLTERSEKSSTLRRHSSVHSMGTHNSHISKASMKQQGSVQSTSQQQSQQQQQQQKPLSASSLMSTQRSSSQMTAPQQMTMIPQGSNQSINSSAQDIYNSNNHQQLQQQNTQLLTSALEEARVTKLSNLQLQEEKEFLEEKIFQMEKQMQEIIQERDQMISRKTSSVHSGNQKMKSVASFSRKSSATGSFGTSFNNGDDEHQGHEEAGEGGGGEEERNEDEEAKEMDDSTLSTLPSNSLLLYQNHHHQQSQLSQFTGENESVHNQEIIIKEMREIGVNTLPNPQLIELNSINEQLTVTLQTMKEKVLFEQSQNQILKEELTKEKSNYLSSVKKCSFLENILRQIHFLYQKEIHEFRNTLSLLRNSLNHFEFFIHNEKETTIQALTLQLQVLLKLFQNNLENSVKQKQKNFLSIYENEKKILEEKYIKQINDLKQKNEKEIEQVHHSYRMNQNYQQTRNLITDSAHSLSSSSSSSPRISLTPAFESTLQGTLQGLLDQSTIDNEISMKIVALAKAHHEPSYAATAAARAIIGEEIDKFMMKLLQKKYSDEDMFFHLQQISPANAQQNSVISNANNNHLFLVDDVSENGNNNNQPLTGNSNNNNNNNINSGSNTPFTPFLYGGRPPLPQQQQFGNNNYQLTLVAPNQSPAPQQETAFHSEVSSISTSDYAPVRNNNNSYTQQNTDYTQFE